ncbi:MAG TPA: sigma-70 family RNA polymerase sigma factor [Intrasporangium sp.]|nr:sigma-70 family RNA polymerase sigma factor [Intrasporangium sp.]
MAADTSMWSSEAWSSAADLYLLARSREGSAEAFGELWRRHLPAGYAVATRYRSRTAAEDIVAEASARVFSLIQEGKGPAEHFRAYFLSAVKTVAIDQGRRELKVVPTEDDQLERLSEPALDDVNGLGEGFDADLIRTAFRGLSERDQRVLWHTTVEGDAPRTLAPVLGMSANAVSARAVRAREALRAQYLDACARRALPNADSEECRWVISHLGAHARGRLPKRQKARVEAHLETCEHASLVAADLRAIHSEFPALIVPLVFLAGLSTPGFVNAAALAGLASGATAGTAGGVGGAGGATGAATSNPPPGAGVGDTAGQLAGRATTLAAGIAIGVGLASAVPLPAQPVVAAQPPAVTSTPPAVPAAPTSTPPPPTSATQPPTVSPARSQAVVPLPAPSLTPAPAPSQPRPVRTTPIRTSAPSAPPTSQPAPSSPAPPPPASSPPAQRVSPAMASVHVVKQRESTRFLLRVRGVEGPLTVVVSTPAGGELTVHNSSWACTSLAPSSLRCTGDNGQAMLLQSGLQAPSPVRVVITDSTGATRTQTLSLA